MNIDEFEGMCPHCGAVLDTDDCNVCGFSLFPRDANQYETPEGNIDTCTEDEAIERGYVMNCPECGEHLITWWEKEDHGMCITCWHNKNKNPLTIE